ncbi:MAG: hypothetical protein FJZ94_04595 [Chloroflexi bacterium]|nr:hypothetical protein [Chloroflexota bacterium]
MGMMDKMMDFMTDRMSQEDKERMMDRMMEKFFGDMTPEEKQKMMAEMMPKMMEGVNMMEMMPQMMMSMMGGSQQDGGMMSRMMGMMSGMRGSHKPGASEHNEVPAMPGMAGCGHEHGMQMMPHMMTEMMPHCLEMMLPNMPKENRADFMAKMVAVLMEQGTAGMTDEEKSECIGKIVEQVTTAGALQR